MGLRRFYGRHFRYWVWRLSNPLKPYEQYYADVIGRKVIRNGRHDVIGRKSRAVRSSSELLNLMVQYGLRPSHRFVDYGCGSLRLGRALIDYLEPENFHGLDVTQNFLDHGVDYIGPEVMAVKKPALDVISPDSLTRARDRRPDYIASWHVCSKVPDHALRRYFESIIGIMHQETQVFIQFPQTDKRRRMNSLNWSLAAVDLHTIVHDIEPRLKVDIVEFIKRNDTGVTESYVRIYFPK